MAGIVKLDLNSPAAKRLQAEVFVKLKELWGNPDLKEDAVAQYTVALVSRWTDRTKIQSNLKAVLGADTDKLCDWLFKYLRVHKDEFDAVASSKKPVAPAAKAAAKPVATAIQPAVPAATQPVSVEAAVPAAAPAKQAQGGDLDALLRGDSAGATSSGDVSSLHDSQRVEQQERGGQAAESSRQAEPGTSQQPLSKALPASRTAPATDDAAHADRSLKRRTSLSRGGSAGTSGHRRDSESGAHQDKRHTDDDAGAPFVSGRGAATTAKDAPGYGAAADREDGAGGAPVGRRAARSAIVWDSSKQQPPTDGAGGARGEGLRGRDGRGGGGSGRHSRERSRERSPGADGRRAARGRDDPDRVGGGGGGGGRRESSRRGASRSRSPPPRQPCKDDNVETAAAAAARRSAHQRLEWNESAVARRDHDDDGAPELLERRHHSRDRSPGRRSPPPQQLVGGGGKAPGGQQQHGAHDASMAASTRPAAVDGHVSDKRRGQRTLSGAMLKSVLHDGGAVGAHDEGDVVPFIPLASAISKGHDRRRGGGGGSGGAQELSPRGAATGGGGGGRKQGTAAAVQPRASVWDRLAVDDSVGWPSIFSPDDAGPEVVAAAPPRKRPADALPLAAAAAQSPSKLPRQASGRLAGTAGAATGRQPPAATAVPAASVTARGREARAALSSASTLAVPPRVQGGQAAAALGGAGGGAQRPAKGGAANMGASAGRSSAAAAGAPSSRPASAAPGAGRKAVAAPAGAPASAAAASGRVAKPANGGAAGGSTAAPAKRPASAAGTAVAGPAAAKRPGTSTGGTAAAAARPTTTADTTNTAKPASDALLEMKLQLLKMEQELTSLKSGTVGAAAAGGAAAAAAARAGPATAGLANGGGVVRDLARAPPLGTAWAGGMRVPNPAADARTVTVRNVNPAVTDVVLRAHFGPCGAIAQCTIVRDQLGAPTGTAFVEFASPESAATALSLDGSLLMMRPIRVTKKGGGGGGGVPFLPGGGLPFVDPALAAGWVGGSVGVPAANGVAAGGLRAGMVWNRASLPAQ